MIFLECALVGSLWGLVVIDIFAVRGAPFTRRERWFLAGLTLGVGLLGFVTAYLLIGAS